MVNATQGLDFFVTPFIEPNSVNNSQLLFLTVVYSLILYQSSGLIADGSELLLLIPSVAGLVGCIVLPILGAVPDGVMTLFSGLGDDAQTEVSLGVGVLAGSTVMLLTFPWFIAVMVGKVPLKGGGEGVTYLPKVQSNAKIMLMTTMIYLVIQIPAIYFEGFSKHPKGLSAKANIAQKKKNAIIEGQEEHYVALVGLILSVAAFVFYMYMQTQTDDNDKQLDRVIKGIQDGEITLGAAIQMGDAPQSVERLLDDAVPSTRQKNNLKVIARPFLQQI